MSDKNKFAIPRMAMSKENVLDKGIFIILGDPLNVNDMEWTPVVYENEEDPMFHKTHLIREIDPTGESYKHLYSKIPILK